jgi:hypothetical protein
MEVLVDVLPHIMYIWTHVDASTGIYTPRYISAPMLMEVLVDIQYSQTYIWSHVDSTGRYMYSHTYCISGPMLMEVLKGILQHICTFKYLCRPMLKEVDILQHIHIAGHVLMEVQVDILPDIYLDPC